MKHYIDENNNVYAFEVDGSQDGLITSNLTPISDGDLAILRQPTEQQIKDARVSEIDNRLNEIDKLTTLEGEAEALRAERNTLV